MDRSKIMVKKTTPKRTEVAVTVTPGKPIYPSASLKPLNFKVPKAFHREFKMYATSHEMAMVDLLRRAFEAFRDSNK